MNDPDRDAAALSFLWRRQAVHRLRREAGTPLRALGLGILVALYALWVVDAVDLFTRPITPVGPLAHDPAEALVSRSPEASVALGTVGWMAAFMAAFSMGRKGGIRFTAADLTFVMASPLARGPAFVRLALAQALPRALVWAAGTPAALVWLGVRPYVVVGTGLALLALPVLVALTVLSATLLGLLLAIRAHRRAPSREARLLAAYVGATALVVGCGIGQALVDGHPFDRGLFAILGAAPFTAWLLPFRGPAELFTVLGGGWPPAALPAAAFWLLLGAWAAHDLTRQGAHLYDFAARGVERQEARAEEDRQAGSRVHAEMRRRAHASRLALPAALATWRPTGVFSLLWQTATVFWRGEGLHYSLATAGLAALTLLAGLASWAGGWRGATWAGATHEGVLLMDVALGLYGLLAMVLLAGATTSASHAIPFGDRRSGDILRPLPFTSSGMLTTVATAPLLVVAPHALLLVTVAVLVWPARAEVIAPLALLAATFPVFMRVGDAWASLASQGNRLLLALRGLGVFAWSYGVFFGAIGSLDSDISPAATAVVYGLLNLLVTVVAAALCARAWESYEPPPD